MIDHLTDAELLDFAAGRLAAEDVLRVDDHLSGCEGCRARAVAVTEAVKHVSALDAQLRDPELHVSDDELQLLINGRLPRQRREMVERHIETCAVCAAQVHELRPWATAGARPAIGRIAIAAAAILAVLVPAALWETRSHLSTTRVPASLAGLEALAPGDQAVVRGALAAGAAPLPPFMAEVTPGRETLMGTPPRPVEMFELIAPVATAVVSQTPVFEWQRLTGADGYVVTIADDRSQVVQRSPVLTTTRWESSVALPRGATYVWQVTAHRGGEAITAPVAPATPARFHIVDDRQAQTLRQVQRDHPGSHLLLGILAANAGVVDDAVTQFEQVAADDSYADVARRSLERLRATARARPRSR